MVDIAESLLQHPGRDVHLVSILVENPEQDVKDSSRERGQVPLGELCVLLTCVYRASVSGTKVHIKFILEKNQNTQFIMITMRMGPLHWRLAISSSKQ